MWLKPKSFYLQYEVIILLAFLSELPFILIVIRIGSLKKKPVTESEALNREALATPEALKDDDEMIERCLRAEESEIGADDRSSVSEINEGTHSTTNSPKFSSQRKSEISIPRLIASQPVEPAAEAARSKSGDNIIALIQNYHKDQKLQNCLLQNTNTISSTMTTDLTASVVREDGEISMLDHQILSNILSRATQS